MNYQNTVNSIVSYNGFIKTAKEQGIKPHSAKLLRRFAILNLHAIKANLNEKAPIICRSLEKIAKDECLTVQTIINYINDWIEKGLIIKAKGYEIGEKYAKNNHYLLTPKAIGLFFINLSNDFTDTYNLLFDFLMKTIKDKRRFIAQKKAKEIKYNTPKPLSFWQRLKNFVFNLSPDTAHKMPDTAPDEMGNTTPALPDTAHKMPVNAHRLENANGAIQPIACETKGNQGRKQPDKMPDTAPDEMGNTTPALPDTAHKIPFYGYWINEKTGNLIKKDDCFYYVYRANEYYQADRRIIGIKLEQTLTCIAKGIYKEITVDEFNFMINNAKNESIIKNDTTPPKKAGNYDSFASVNNLTVELLTKKCNSKYLKQ